MSYRPNIEPAIIIEVLAVIAITIGVGFVWWPLALIIGGCIFYLLAQGISR